MVWPARKLTIRSYMVYIGITMKQLLDEDRLDIVTVCAQQIFLSVFLAFNWGLFAKVVVVVIMR